MGIAWYECVSLCDLTVVRSPLYIIRSIDGEFAVHTQNATTMLFVDTEERALELAHRLLKKLGHEGSLIKQRMADGSLEVWVES